MVKYPSIVCLVLFAVCGTSAAATLTLSASGQFSSSDTAGVLVAPNGLFSFGFNVNDTATPAPGSVTALGFDVPVSNFVYRLNGNPIAVTPTEIRFNTLANGGAFDVTFGSDLSSLEFSFEGSQLFTGTTSAPVFAAGNFAITGWNYSDASNFDPGSGSTQSVSLATTTPEPSTSVLISLSLLTLGGLIARKSVC